MPAGAPAACSAPDGDELVRGQRPVPRVRRDLPVGVSHPLGVGRSLELDAPAGRPAARNVVRSRSIESKYQAQCDNTTWSKSCSPNRSSSTSVPRRMSMRAPISESTRRS
jgi:hypothetical protein